MDSSYFKAPLPGNHEGISASTFTGQYLGINKYISEEKANAAAIVLQFLASKEFQKKVILENDHIYYSAIPSLYDDEEICSVVDCDLMKNIQPVLMPIREDYDSFSNNIRHSIYKYLYEEASVNEAINNINIYLSNDFKK